MATPIAAKSAAHTPFALEAATPAREGAFAPLISATDAETTLWDAPRSSAAPNTTPLRAELAPHVAKQLVQVMAQAAHKPVEIALSPHELGRVRMSITAEDGAITVNILAERPDTLDLMRRHIDQLGHTFRAMGYDQIAFSFGQGGDADGNTPTDRDSPPDERGAPEQTGGSLTAAPDATAAGAATLINLTTAASRGVDIRL